MAIHAGGDTSLPNYTVPCVHQACQTLMTNKRIYTEIIRSTVDSHNEKSLIPLCLISRGNLECLNCLWKKKFIYIDLALNRCHRRSRQIGDKEASGDCYQQFEVKR